MSTDTSHGPAPGLAATQAAETSQQAAHAMSQPLAYCLSDLTSTYLPICHVLAIGLLRLQ